MSDLHRLSGIHDNTRLVAAIQCATLQILFGAFDTANRQTENTDKRSDHCASPCGDWHCNCPRTQRAGNTRAGEVKNDGGSAAGSQT